MSKIDLGALRDDIGDMLLSRDRSKPFSQEEKDHIAETMNLSKQFLSQDKFKIKPGVAVSSDQFTQEEVSANHAVRMLDSIAREKGLGREIREKAVEQMDLIANKTVLGNSDAFKYLDSNKSKLAIENLEGKTFKDPVLEDVRRRIVASPYLDKDPQGNAANNAGLLDRMGQHVKQNAKDPGLAKDAGEIVDILNMVRRASQGQRMNDQDVTSTLDNAGLGRAGMDIGHVIRDHKASGLLPPETQTGLRSLSMQAAP